MQSVAVEFSGARPLVDDEAASVFDIGNLTIATDLATLETEWRAAEATAIGHVFQTFDFVASWFATVGRAQGVKPLVVVGRCRQGSTLFVLPFAIRRLFGRRVVEWAGGDQADYQAGLFSPRYLGGLAANPAHGEALVQRVARLLAGHGDVLNLRRQPLTLGPSANPFATFHARPHAVQSHHTRLGTDWEVYYRGKRNSGSRRTDRAKQTRLAAAGNLRIFDATEPAEARRIVEILLEQKSRSFEALGIQSFLDCPGASDFTREMADHLWPNGPCHVAAVELDGEIIAANWGLVSSDRYYYVLHSYGDGPIGRESPGRQLMYHLMQWAIERGMTTFDFTIGDEDYKAQWCEESATLADSIAPLNLRGVDLALALRTAKWAKRKIKNSTRAMSAFDAARPYLPAILR